MLVDKPGGWIVALGAVMSLDGYIRMDDDMPGPLFDWYFNGDVEVQLDTGDGHGRYLPRHAVHLRGDELRGGAGLEHREAAAPRSRLASGTFPEQVSSNQITCHPGCRRRAGSRRAAPPG
jgi:hypothetical protein